MKKGGISFFLITLAATLFTSACDRFSMEYSHPDFVTRYTEDEHLERLSKRTEARYAKEFADGVFVSYTVDIVYAFSDEAPEYFLIELEYAQENQTSYENPFWDPEDENSERWITCKTNYCHIIGYIENDEYKLGLYGYGDTLKQGKSSYRASGNEESRKYYGFGVEAVEKDGKIIRLFDWYACVGGNSRGISSQFHTHVDTECCFSTVIPEEQYEVLMKNNKKFPSLISIY